MKGKSEDWGVFGLGNMPGQAAVISSFRLERKAEDAAHLRHRVVTTAIHEIGIANTDASTGHLGPRCRAELDREMPLQRPRSR